MTAKRFTTDYRDFLKEDMTFIKNNDKRMTFQEIVDLLNEQHETIERLKDNIDELLSVDIEEELLKENEQLKSSDTITDLETQIMKLKQENEQLKSRCNDYDKALKTLQGLTDRKLKENEQLKHSIKCLEADKMELQQYIKRMQGDVE